MAIPTIIYITLALLAALGFSFLMYLFRKKPWLQKDYVFFSLRALAIFIVFLLLINPKIISTEYELEKPELVLLVDNSESINFLDAQTTSEKFINSIYESEDLLNNFDVRTVPFGKQLSNSDSLNFSESESDLNRALEESYETSSKRMAVVLLTDGNQNIGSDYKYYKKPQDSKVFPVIVGDTSTYADLRIDRINVNRYAFLNNKFPVEIFTSYSGNQTFDAEVRIRQGKNIIFRQTKEFSPTSASQIFDAEIPASSIGLQRFSVEIDILEEEKNKNNNELNFAIEVIDERTSVLILSELKHPDLGALKKAIESNEQRVTDIKYLNKDNFQLKDYQLVIMYQVNNRFKNIIQSIQDQRINIFYITGSETDWNFLNQLEVGVTRNSSNQVQDVFPEVNENFSSFQFEDIGFDDFPPLEDRFGTLDFNESNLDILLFQKIQGIQTNEPLLAVRQTTPKTGFLLGENIWRWRAKSYLDTKSFSAFDQFIGQLIQNMSSGKRRDRLTVDAENFYYANQEVIINAQYFDQNYQFDANATLTIKIADSSNTTIVNSEFINQNNSYRVNGGNLPAGNYDFTVNVQGDNLSRSGSFQVIAYNLEQQQSSANLKAMQQFAENNKADLFYPDQVDLLIENLLKEESFRPVQKSRQKAVPLIDWYYLLFILIFILAAEWFYRKYLGLI